MRPGQHQQNRRGRGRTNNTNNSNNNTQNRKGQHHHNPLMRTYQSNGPDQKIHGTPAQIAEKYMSLARDALSSGDHVLAENYLQHAEHYNRIILSYREQQMQQNGGEAVNGNMPRHRPFPGVGEPFEPGDGEDGDEGGDPFQMGQQPQMGMRSNEPQPRMYDPNEGRQNEGRQNEGRQSEGRGDERPRPQQGDRQQYGDRQQSQGQQRERDGNRDRDSRDGNRDNRDANRDGGRNFRQRDQRLGGDRAERPDRGDRGTDRPADRGDRQERFVRNDSSERPERNERFDRGDRNERGDRNDRPDRGPRPSYAERTGDMPERPAPVAASVDVERERHVEAAPPPVAAVAEAPAVAPTPRRRERFVEPASEQPEFLRRPVRRPRREASAPETADEAPPVRTEPTGE